MSLSSNPVFQNDVLLDILRFEDEGVREYDPGDADVMDALYHLRAASLITYGTIDVNGRPGLVGPRYELTALGRELALSLSRRA